MRPPMLLAAALAAFLSAAPAAAQTWRIDQIADLERAAQAADLEGLPVPEAALEQMRVLELLSQADPSLTPALDLAADALFVQLAEAYARGAIEPATIDGDWHIPRPDALDAASLLAAVGAGQRPGAVLGALLPHSSDYQALRQELARLRADPDGAGNGERLTQVLANLERWRWLPRVFPARRIEVRLAQYQLDYFDGVNAAPTHYDVIVGAPRSPSPVFAATITSITLNPDWDPPASIVSRELAPRFARNPAAAAREGFEVLDEDGRSVDAATVNWRARPFPYHLRQLPGPLNALGRLRFDLPNPFAVYLHDTPSPSLFDRDVRAFSHGCIRVKTPGALAAALLGEGWTDTSIADATAAGATQTIALNTPTPVYLIYLTVITSDDGAITYLDDINRRDAAILAALTGAPPAASASALAHSATCAYER